MINVKEMINLHGAGIHSLGRFPICNNLDELEADIAIIGVPYEASKRYCSGTRFGPKAVRDSFALLNSQSNGSYDQEQDGVYLDPSWRIVDCGDVEVVHGDLETTFKNIEETIEKVISRGAMPIVLGGDHSITVPVASALKNKGSFYAVQIDSFLDFASHKPEQSFGQGNPMRCISEMAHVEGMAQLGIRGCGSNRKEDCDAAKENGNMILSPRRMREIGVQEILNRIPDSERYFVTIDMDGMDIYNNSGSPSKNDGVYYQEVYELLEGLVKKGEVIGFDFVEIDPSSDHTGGMSQMVARLTHDLINLVLTA